MAPIPLTRARRDFWLGMEPRLAVYLDSFPGLGAEAKEEILQKGLEAYWAKGQGLRDDARSWLYRVVRNAALDALRASARERRRRGELQDMDAIASPPARYPQPEEALIKAEDEAFVSRFLASLPSRDRELLHLAFAEESTYPEIARILGIPVGTVKWRVHALKTRLSRAYEKEFGHGS